MGKYVRKAKKGVTRKGAEQHSVKKIVDKRVNKYGDNKSDKDMADGFVYTSLPIRNAALKQISKILDSEVDEEVNASEKTVAKRRSTRRKSNAKATTPKKISKVDTLSTLMKKELTMGRKEIAKPKKRVERANEDTESEADRGDPTWFNGIATPKQLSMDKLKFPVGNHFLGKYKILEVVEIDEAKGGTYIAYGHRTEVTLRVNFIQKDDMEMVNTEAKFLEMMELNGAQHFFATVYEMGIVNKAKPDGMIWYAVLYRPGVTLQQCRTFVEEEGGLPTSEIRPETVDRLASQLVKILEQIFGQGYRILSFSMDDFKMDYRSRRAFLQTYKNIVKAEGINLAEIGDEAAGAMLAGREKKRIGWEGDEDLAPVNWHIAGKDHVMSEMDSIESLVYLLIQIHRGTLPWTGKAEKKALKLANADLSVDSALIKLLPPSLKCLWLMVRTAESSRVSFPYVYRILTKYSNDDQDYVYDWEYAVHPDPVQERLVALSYLIDDTKIMYRAGQCILDNETRLARRK